MEVLASATNKMQVGVKRYPHAMRVIRMMSAAKIRTKCYNNGIYLYCLCIGDCGQM